MGARGRLCTPRPQFVPLLGGIMEQLRDRQAQVPTNPPGRVGPVRVPDTGWAASWGGSAASRRRGAGDAARHRDMASRRGRRGGCRPAQARRRRRAVGQEAGRGLVLPDASFAPLKQCFRKRASEGVEAARAAAACRMSCLACGVL